jgi:hypothetical protein
MYGKIFESTFSGSMVGAGTAIFAVWAYALAHVRKGRVELNPVLIASILGTDVQTVEAAIASLCAPDPRSRSKEHDGKRLIREGQFQYWMPTHAKYQDIRNEDDRRSYNRQKKAEQRARDAGKVAVSKRVSLTVNDCQAVSAHTEADPKSDPNPNPESKKQSLANARVIEEIYQQYPRKAAKPDALRAITKALKKIPADELLSKVKAFFDHCHRTGKEQRFIPYASRWFNQEGWNDALVEPAAQPQRPPATAPAPAPANHVAGVFGIEAFNPTTK